MPSEFTVTFSSTNAHAPVQFFAVVMDMAGGISTIQTGPSGSIQIPAGSTVMEIRPYA